jgi:diketogulonate reductase-like aldo/keto reductase
MPTRRQFLHSGSAALAAMSCSWSGAGFAADQPRLMTRPIPGTDETLPIVGLGNAEAFNSGDVELSRELVSILLDRGGSYIDTTGRGRFVIADIMREMRAQERVFPGTYIAPTEEMDMRHEIEAVRAAQGNSAPLDLVLTRNIAAYGDDPDKYRRLKEEGLTRFTGVARHQQRYHLAMMDLMQAGAVDFVQVNYSMLEPEAADRVLPMAQDKGVAVLINRPFINGQFFSLVRGQTLPEWAAEFDCESWAQFAVKWIVAHPAVNCVLTETSNPRHAEDNIGGGIGRLPDEKTRQRMRQLILEMV